MTTRKIELPAGDVTEGVVRAGDTVRRPHQTQSYAVAAYLDHLESVGFEGSPRFLGLDRQGRDVLTFMAGEVPGAVVEPEFRTDEVLASVARIVVRLQAASEGYVPAEEPFPRWPIADGRWEIVGHMDITPQNVTFRDGEAVGLIDFDLARPTTRLLEAYNTAMHWVPILAPEDLPGWSDAAGALRRLRLFADAVGWTAAQRAQLPSLGADAADRSWMRMKARAETEGGGWARMWSEGVGELIRRRAKWLRDNETTIVRALER